MLHTMLVVILSAIFVACVLTAGSLVSLIIYAEFFDNCYPAHAYLTPDEMDAIRREMEN